MANPRFFFFFFFFSSSSFSSSFSSSHFPLQPAEIYNNVGSLLHKMEKYDLGLLLLVVVVVILFLKFVSPFLTPSFFSPAEASYLRAIKENNSKLEDFSDENITISYNLGRLYEDQFRYEDASRFVYIIYWNNDKMRGFLKTKKYS